LSPFIVAVAEQGAVLEALRGSGGGSLRERLRAASDATFRAGGEHGAGQRSSLFGAVGGGQTEACAAADGGGRGLPGEKADVHNRSEQPGESGAVVVRSREEEALRDYRGRRQAPPGKRFLPRRTFARARRPALA